MPRQIRHFATVAVAYAVALVAVGCSSSPSHNANGVTPGNSTSPSASASSSPSASASASPGSTSPAAQSPGASASPGQTVASGPGSKPPGKPSGITRAGTYTYDDSGTRQTPTGPQPVSGSDTVTYAPPQNSTQRNTKQTGGGSQQTTLRVNSSGLYVVDLHIMDQSFDEDFVPTGTALFFPANYSVGKTWSWSAKSRDGKYTFAVTSKVSSVSSSATVGGQSLSAVIVDSVIHLTGNGFDLTDNVRDWVSTQYALVLKEHAVESGTVDTIKLNSDTTRTLRSTSPA